MRTLDDELRALYPASKPRSAAPGAALRGNAPPEQTAMTDVDGALLLDDTVRFIQRFVVLSRDQLRAVALWVAHTHAIEAADATPYLNIRSAEKRSGKTRLLEVLELFVARPWRTGRTSAAALVRKIDGTASTLLLDESDAAFKGDREYSEALRGILNDGHRRGGCTTICVGKGADIKARDFSVFGPKAIAGIGNALPDTVRDRSIDIELKRQAADERAERFYRRIVEPTAAALRTRIESWAAAYAEDLKACHPMVIEEISDRAFDGWEPLLAIAETVGGKWPLRAREAAIRLSGSVEVEDDSAGVQLLRDIRSVFKACETARLHTEHLLEQLCAIGESPWATWHRGKPLSARGLARLLRAYGIQSKQVWLDETNKHGYLSEDFADAWRRYLVTTPPNARSARTSTNTGVTPNSETLGHETSSGSKDGASPEKIAVLASLADKGSNLSAGAPHTETPRSPYDGQDGAANTHGGSALLWEYAGKKVGLVGPVVAGGDVLGRPGFAQEPPACIKRVPLA
jgi:hypothetical protein